MDLIKRELEALDFWQKNRIFEKSLAQRKRGRHFVFYDGPPFATGQPHYGHILASIIKDVIGRYQTMKGNRVERRWGWDCHGLPLENLIEQELKLKTRKDILEYGIDKFNHHAKEQVLRYAEDWKKVIPRIGRWVDMENAYLTMDWRYTETIWWIFKTLYEKGLIYEGRKSMHVCPRCETTLANFEVTQGYKEITDVSVYVKFKLAPGQRIRDWGFVPENTSMVVWTTTPWTLPGNVALAVARDHEYEMWEQNGENLIVAADRREAVGVNGKPASRGVLSGEGLIGLTYEPLFDYYFSDPELKNRENGWKIYPADFVSTEEGTGVVHIAPAFGEEDMALGEKYKLPFIQHITTDGKFKPEVKDFASLPVKPKDDHLVTDKKITSHLESRGLLFAKEPITHSYPHCWRCETPLLNYAASSWFVKVTAIKKQLIAENKKIRWVPAHIRDGRFGKWLEGARDWAISRQRFWGAPIPVWKCKSCGSQKVIGSLEELEKESPGTLAKHLADKNSGYDLHRPAIDAVKLSCACLPAEALAKEGGGEMERIADVFDCWFESGSMPYGQWHWPFENKKYFNPAKGVGFPADFIAEGIDMTRGWFYSLLVIAVALFKKTPYRNVITSGIVLAEDGQKMSKRLKNYPDPMDVVSRYGADALRFYLLSQPVVAGEDLNFSLHELDEVYKKFNLIVTNTLNFFSLYKNALQGKLQAPSSKLRAHILDRWILSRLNSTIETATAALEAYDLIPVTRALLDFVRDLSLWYVRRSRERIRSEGAGSVQALAILERVLYDLSRMMAPATPFLAETIYQAIHINPTSDIRHLTSEVRSLKSSVQLEDWPRANRRLINKKLEADMKAVRQIVSHALRLRVEAGVRVRQPLRKLRIKNHGLRSKELLNLIKDEVNVKEVVFDPRLKTDLALDTRVTPDLKEEGIVRELVRAIQDCRKRQNLQPGERATVSLGGLTRAFLGKWRRELETRTHSHIVVYRLGERGEHVMIEDKEVIVTILRDR